MSNYDRMLDAEIAVEEYGWKWEGRGFNDERKFLVPPADNKMRTWCAMWDDNGIPHYLPRYTEEKISRFKDILDADYTDRHDNPLLYFSAQDIRWLIRLFESTN